ncbi:MAG: hydantoinase/oxoprolinase family protein, partial [Candidatus Bathyarchaeia archaeon]
ITTKGFDILDIQRANRRDIFNFKYKKPTPFVPRHMIEWVDERIDGDGAISKPLDVEGVQRAVESLLRKGANAFAVGFINSYQNPIHEIKAKENAERILMNCGFAQPFVTTSSELSREWKEYERFNTAVLNAYVQPIFAQYLQKLENALRAKGFGGVFYLTLAAGGMVTADYAKKYPIFTVEGGPIAGIVGGILLGQLLGENNLIIIDGGSTTTKAGLVHDLTLRINTEYWIEQDEWKAGYPLRVPVIDINEIGTGGTSVVWVDEAGNLQVGPKAAGARPGPVCYGMGGRNPTLTDAYVVAGYLNPHYLLGGKLPIRSELAEEAFRKLAAQVNLSVPEVAHGVIRVANDNSANLIRQISIRKGFDPREFTLIAHGGSGPMLAPFIAEELDIRKILVPAIPSGVFNAWSMIGLDVRHEVVQTRTITVEETEEFSMLLNEVFRELEHTIKTTFENENINPSTVEIIRYVDMKYAGQAHTIKIGSPNGDLGVEQVVALKQAFHEAHFKEFGFSLVDSDVEVVSFHAVGLHKVVRPKIEKRFVKGALDDAELEKRKIYHGMSTIVMPVYKQEIIPTGIPLRGPCLIEGETTTIVVTESFEACRDEYGNIVLVRRC